LTNRLSTNTVIGHLWTTGFSTGDLKTPLFEDVVPTLEAWKAAGKVLAIFSSGSVQAQLQFFSYVRDGQSTRDIKHLFAAHYDTVNAGPKLEKASYEKICRELGHDVSKVSFLTDNVKGMPLHVPISAHSLHETPHPYIILTPYHVTARDLPHHHAIMYTAPHTFLLYLYSPRPNVVTSQVETSVTLAIFLCAHSHAATHLTVLLSAISYHVAFTDCHM
jgi:hypothetical protein